MLCCLQIIFSLLSALRFTFFFLCAIYFKVIFKEHILRCCAPSFLCPVFVCAASVNVLNATKNLCNLKWKKKQGPYMTVKSNKKYLNYKRLLRMIFKNIIFSNPNSSQVFSLDMFEMFGPWFCSCVHLWLIYAELNPPMSIFEAVCATGYSGIGTLFPNSQHFHWYCMWSEIALSDLIRVSAYGCSNASVDPSQKQTDHPGQHDASWARSQWPNG